jgi:uncharacterized protein with PIN domain
MQRMQRIGVSQRRKLEMIRGRNDETVELRCPECGASVQTTTKEAEKGKVRCPRGHEFAVMGMLGGLNDAGRDDKRNE